MAQVFIDDVTEHRNSQVNSEVYSDSAKNSANLIGRCFTVQMDNDPKQTAKGTQEDEYSAMPMFLSQQRLISRGGK